MKLGQRQTIRHDRLPKLLVCVDDDVGRIEQSLLWQDGRLNTVARGAFDKAHPAGLISSQKPRRLSG